MIGTRRPSLRIHGAGSRLHLRVREGKDLLDNVRECCRAATAVDKALGEAVQAALDGGHTWRDVGRALGAAPDATAAEEVLDGYTTARRYIWMRFWGVGQAGH